MSNLTAAPPRRRASALGRVHRRSISDYRRMGETGILGPELRTELIDGEIIELPRYARAGIPEVWLVDLASGRLWVYRQPAQGRYTEVEEHKGVGTVTLPISGQGRIDLTGVF